jgi:multidrug efflux system membrane fusion protein
MLHLFSFRVLLLGAATLLSVSSCGLHHSSAAPVAAEPAAEASPATSEKELIPVRTVALTARPLSEGIRASGKLRSATELQLSFKVGGMVATLQAREGDLVQRGQVLAQLNMTEIKAQVNQARQAYDKANRELHRTQSLYRDSVTTLEQVQNARTGTETSRAGLRIAEFNQQYATIVAPVSGRVLRRSAEPGELVAAGAPVFVISSADAPWVLHVGLADRDIVRVKLGDVAQVHLDAYPERDFSGRVTRLAQASDPASGTYDVEITVQPAGQHLVSGLVGEATITPLQSAAVATVPVEALVSADGQRGYIYSLRGRGPAVQQHAVRVLRLLDDGQVAIQAQVPAGTPIISSGAAYLTPSSQVTLAR